LQVLIKQSASLGQFNSSDFTLCVKKLDPCIIVTRNNTHKLFSQFNVKMLTENILHPLLQQMFKMASLCMDISPQMSSLFVTRRLPHRQLSAVHQTRPHSDAAGVVT